MDTIEFVKAMADETRQEIMRLCCCRELNVSEIVDALNVSQPTVSHHLAILKSAGLVKVRREGKQIFYSLNQKRISGGCCSLAEIFSPDHRLSETNCE